MLFWNLLLLSSFACLASSMPYDEAALGCPQVIAINPCTCNQDMFFQSSLSCSEDIQSVNQLKQIFSNCSGRLFQEVKIENASLENIPAEIFETSEIKSLFLTSSSLTQLFERAPKIQYRVHVLTLTALEIQNGLDFKYFSEIPFLDMLTLSEINIPLIGKDFYDYVSPELTFLSFEKSGTQSVSSGAFSRLTKLSSLTIADAEITSLSRNILPYPSQVENIFLNYNKLTNLPDDIFSGMPSLKVVSLVGNNFSTFEQATFVPAWGTLEYIGLDANLIHCDCAVRWMTLEDDTNKVRGTCSSPAALFGRDLKNLKEEDFDYCEDES